MVQKNFSGKGKRGIQLQMAVNSSAEQSTEYGCVLAQLRGLDTEVSKSAKTFKLDLAGFQGEVPEQYDGLCVELFPSEQDSQTEKYAIPADFVVVEIKSGAYKPQRTALDVDAYLASLGIASVK